MVPVRTRRGHVCGPALAAVVLVVGVPAAGASESGQVAFTTSQAPGGAATAANGWSPHLRRRPGPFTPQVLSVLQRFQVPATFSEIGEEVARYPQYSKMVAAAGYPVEDHT